MKWSLLVPAVAVCGMTTGCNTGVEDVRDAQSNLRQTQNEADQLVVDARTEGDGDVHETKKIVVEEINEEARDVNEATDTAVHEGADVLDATRDGRKEIAAADARRDEQIAEAKRDAGEKVAEAQRDLQETKREAIEDGRKKVKKCQEEVTAQEQDLVKAKAEMVAAEIGLKNATDDNRAELQEQLNAAEKAVTDADAEVTEAKDAMKKELAELKAIESAVP